MKKVNCILLVDDDEGDNFLHDIIIKKADVCNTVKLASDGEKALDYVIKSNVPGNSEKYPIPDIIYLDINMPRMSGFDFLEEYQKLDDAYKSKVVIIMLSTSLNPKDKEKASLYDEVKEFQFKPITVESLHETVEKYF